MRPLRDLPDSSVEKQPENLAVHMFFGLCGCGSRRRTTPAGTCADGHDAACFVNEDCQEGRGFACVEDRCRCRDPYKQFYSAKRCLARVGARCGGDACAPNSACDS